jgi:hypothetical protein
MAQDVQQNGRTTMLVPKPNRVMTPDEIRELPLGLFYVKVRDVFGEGLTAGCLGARANATHVCTLRRGSDSERQGRWLPLARF